MPKQDNERSSRYRRKEVEPQKAARNIRKYADDDFDEQEYYRREREVSRKARRGCLLAILVGLILLLIAAGIGWSHLKKELNIGKKLRKRNLAQRKRKQKKSLKRRKKTGKRKKENSCLRRRKKIINSARNSTAK